MFDAEKESYVLDPSELENAFSFAGVSLIRTVSDSGLNRTGEKDAE